MLGLQGREASWNRGLDLHTEGGRLGQNALSVLKLGAAPSIQESALECHSGMHP